MGQILAVYADEHLYKEIMSLTSDDIVKAGTSKEIMIYVKNVSDFELQNVTFKSDDPDVRFDPPMVTMFAVGQVIPVKFIWSPPIDRDTPLRAQIYAEVYIIRRA